MIAVVLGLSCAYSGLLSLVPYGRTVGAHIWAVDVNASCIGRSWCVAAAVLKTLSHSCATGFGEAAGMACLVVGVRAGTVADEGEGAGADTCAIGGPL